MAVRGTKPKSIGELANDLVDRSRGPNPELDKEPTRLSRHQKTFWDECIRYNHALTAADRPIVDLLLPYIDDIRNRVRLKPSELGQVRSLMSDLYLVPSARIKFIERPKRSGVGKPPKTAGGEYADEPVDDRPMEDSEEDDDGFLT